MAPFQHAVHAVAKAMPHVTNLDFVGEMQFDLGSAEDCRVALSHAFALAIESTTVRFM
jgi:hypothetical protein